MKENELSADVAGAAGQIADDDGIPVDAIAKLLIAGLVIAAVVVFVLQNLDSVPVNFLSWSFDAPLILLLAGAGVVGILLKWLIGFIRSRRKRSK